MLQTLAILWAATGLVKAVMFTQQVPSVVNWYVFYTTDDSEFANNWYRHPVWILVAITTGITAAIGFILAGPTLFWREGISYFRPYSDCFLASCAAHVAKMDIGIEPGEFEEWDEWRARVEQNEEYRKQLTEQLTADEDEPTRNARESVQRIDDTDRQ